MYLLKQINTAITRQANASRHISILTGMNRVNKSTTLQLLSKVWSGQSGVLAGKQAEEKMTSILRNKFPKAQTIEVNDISGGCGAMFEVNVITCEFDGLSTVKQHRLINDTLKNEIKDMHGIRISTGLPDSS
ncbi:GSCOCG00008966001-RA-CDS [Cotesia congregata]|uniref:Similar to BOLA3: BolA-like protein 3 (Bos taurus) n=1 Tax=Cotesia congregata TaxID=51543 RepID=A0A8J2MP50_COTCN|nr:GSCOCG00008966001-RA-CDS [Cotesia congregata]CAG5099592.1 Similar to BOLA3: BolA-like protein 3 (Bos taurus) [Cotesia congregata]